MFLEEAYLLQAASGCLQAAGEKTKYKQKVDRLSLETNHVGRLSLDRNHETTRHKPERVMH